MKMNNGFSLIEMAIVLFIIALLLGGLLPIVSNQIDQQHRNDTRKQLDEIQQALTGYAIINGRLPSPACGTIPTLPGVNNNAGIELIPASAPLCTTGAADIAVLPWVTLGISETDGWGRRFTYSVAPNFAATGGFTLTTTSTLKILDAAGGNTIANGLPAVIISQGSNGLGAYNPQGTKIPTAGAGADEIINATSGTTSYINHDARPDFDDIVVWISPNNLLNRMVSAGKLP